MRTIGVISDTHGLLRPEALEALRGSELIVHAGDVVGEGILDTLAEIAPVCAVRGNMDWGHQAAALPPTSVVDLSAPDGAPAAVHDSDGHTAPSGTSPELAESGHGPLAYVLHDLADLDLDPAAAGFAVVVHGHTHRPALEERSGVLYLNPGSAGPRRSGRPVSLARLRVEGAVVEAEIVELDVGL